jgi:hypothetical protein
MLISRQPARHAATHQNGGSDEVATATPAANAIPKAGSGGTLAAGWLPIMGASGTNHAAGAAPDPGSTAGSTRYLREDATWAVPPGNTSSMPRGYIDGLILANNGSGTQSISVAQGACRDSTNAQDITLASVFFKSLAGTWTQGTGSSGSPVNGLDTGSVAASTWYHVFVISNGTNVDVLFSTSASSPTMPGGWSYRRRIGSIRTDASKNVLGFVQVGDEFLWNTQITDANNATLGTTITNVTLTVPTGVQVWAIFGAGIKNSGGVVSLSIYSPDEQDTSATGFFTVCLGAITSQLGNAAWVRIRTNTSAAIRCVASLASSVLDIGTVGWVDQRGRNS